MASNSTAFENARADSPCKCPVARDMMATPDNIAAKSGARPAPNILNKNLAKSYDSTQEGNTPPPVFPECTNYQKRENDFDEVESGDTGDDIDDTDSPRELQPDEQPWRGQRDDQQPNFTEGAAQKAAQAVGVGAAYTLNAARIGAREGLKAANIGAEYAVDAAKKAGVEASKYRLLSPQFWTNPIPGVDDGSRELTEPSDEPGTSGLEPKKDPAGNAYDMIDRCEKTREYDGKLRTRLMGGVTQYLTDTAMLLALSSSFTLNTIFRPLEKQPRAYRGGIPKTPTFYTPYLNPDSPPIVTSSFPSVDTGTAGQAKWVRLLLIDSMVLSLIALFIGYSAMGIVQAFNPWGWMAKSETGKPSPSDKAGDSTGFKSDFNDPSHAVQSSSLSQKLQLQARKTQFETLKMRLPLVYLFPRIFQVALLFFVCGFVGLMWFVWTNEVGFARYFKGVFGSSAALPLVAVGIMTVVKKIASVR